MNWVAAVVTFVLLAWIAGWGAVFTHLFRDRWFASELFFITVVAAVLSLPVSIAVFFWVGGN